MSLTPVTNASDRSPDSMRTIFINGKFAAQRVTGVQRLASNLVQGLDRLLLDLDSPDRWVLLCPPTATLPILKKIEVRLVGPRLGGLHAWEQGFLLLYTAGRILLNFAGPAPLLKRRQVCMIPDAAVFDQPKAYTRAFGAWYRLLFRTVSRSARVLLTISDFSRQQLSLALGVNPSRLKVVFCAASHMQDILPDASVIERLGLAKIPYLLAVGSANPTKNLPALVEAFQALSADVRLVLVGGSNSAVFAGASASKSVDPRIVSTGAIDDSELRSLYSGALAFVFPSLYEGFGLPPLEAMFLKCPVVVSRAASMPEVCGDAALYFDPHSILGITQALSLIVNDAVLRNQLRHLGTEHVQRFTWDNAARQLFSHLLEEKLVTRATI